MLSNRTSLCALLAMSLVACKHVVYYEPSGSGHNVIGPSGAPSIREIKIDSGLKIDSRVDGNASEPVLTFFIDVHAGTLRLSASELQFSCGEIRQTEAFNTLSASRTLEGAWNVIEVPLQTELVAQGAALSVGGVSDGRYWLKTALPQCANAKEIAVQLPEVAGRAASLPTKPIVFHLREGHFLPFSEVM